MKFGQILVVCPIRDISANIHLENTLVAGLLARSQYPEGPVTGHLGSFFLISPCLKANAEMVPKTPSCYCMLLM